VLSTRIRAVVQLAALTCAGCVDPQGRYDDFIERTADLRNRDSGPMEPSDRFDWSGRYLLALSTTLAPDTPLLFAAEAEVSSDLSSVALQLQPLTSDQDDEPRMPIGERFGVSDVPYEEDGTFDADLGDISVPGRANPITGSDIVANVQLAASTRAAADDLPVVFCGQVTGMVVEPIALDLAGSSFGAVQTEDERAAEPLLRCARP
jgi:hypothetical protein